MLGEHVQQPREHVQQPSETGLHSRFGLHQGFTINDLRQNTGGSLLLQPASRDEEPEQEEEQDSATAAAATRVIIPQIQSGPQRHEFVTIQVIVMRRSKTKSWGGKIMFLIFPTPCFHDFTPP